METPIRVTIDQEAVERQVVQAIIESAVGKRLEEAINEALKQPERYGSDTLVARAVKEVVHETIREEIANQLQDNKEFNDRLRTIVEEETTDDVLRAFVTRIFTIKD